MAEELHTEPLVEALVDPQVANPELQKLLPQKRL
jgi:hypothetical protein